MAIKSSFLYLINNNNIFEQDKIREDKMKKKYLAFYLFLIIYFLIIVNNNYIILNNNIKNITEENNNHCELVEGDFSIVGSEIKCGDELFYIIESNQDIVTLFSKYNLNANKQDSNGLNYQLNNVISFDFKDYSAILNLEDNLKSIGLITKEELEQLGCSIDKHTCKTSEYSWLYSTSYWISSPSESYKTIVYKVTTDGNFDYYTSADNEEEYGIRPVITILKSAIYIDGGIDEKDETATKKEINRETVVADNIDNNITINLNIGEKIFYIVDLMIIIIFLMAIIYMELTGRNKYINVFQKK